VVQLERSIEARLAAADEARVEVARAHQQAAQVVSEAAEEAERDARRLAEVILADARAEAGRVIEAGTHRAADLTALTARRRDEDVAAVVATVLAAGIGPGPEAVNRP
jgi:hypothetical protein